MNKKTIQLGLIGKDVSKSTSEPIHRFILSQFGVECLYTRFSVTPQQFDATVCRLLKDFDGFNITIPYKRDILAYLQGVNGDALKCGAVNTVVCHTRQGYNTDGVGFLLMLENAGITVENKKVLLLGGGGAGRSTAVALKNAGANVFMYRRNQVELEKTCKEIGIQAVTEPEMGGFDMLINTTGVGMHDTEGLSPVSEKAFEGAKEAVDLIYVPTESQFLRIAKAKGLTVINGEAMLFYQAYYADCLYLGIQANGKQAKAFYKDYLAQKK